MPAAELQIALSLTDRLQTKNGHIAVVAKCEKVGTALSAAFGAGHTVAVFRDLASLPAGTHFDGLVLNKVELDALVTVALGALKTGGIAVIREDLSISEDTKKVAKLTDFFDVFRSENTGFDFYAVTPADKNWQDFLWTLIKKEFPPSKDGNVTFRDFLDKTQYTDTGIYAYEWIFGQDFISPGGWPENLRVLQRFGTLRPGQTMLDIGVGIGGGARQAASEFGIHVTGIDLSSNMLAVALERNHRDKDTRVKYMVTDALVYDFEEAQFDYVFSRDCIQHIPDTQQLFNRIYKWLKPGGKVLITMYGVGYGKLSAKFEEYVAQRAYFLKNRDQIREFAQKSGFESVVVENLTPRFREILLEERDRVENNKDEFFQKFSEKEYNSLVVGWNNKLGYIADDNHNWNLFIATKPKH